MHVHVHAHACTRVHEATSLTGLVPERVQLTVHTTEPTGTVPEPFHCDHIARWSARSGTSGRSGTGLNTGNWNGSGTVLVSNLWCEHGLIDRAYTQDLERLMLTILRPWMLKSQSLEFQNRILSTFHRQPGNKRPALLSTHRIANWVGLVVFDKTKFHQNHKVFPLSYLWLIWKYRTFHSFQQTSIGAYMNQRVYAIIIKHWFLFSPGC